MASGESIAVNVKRRLWADCAGYCQNPDCNKYLFKDFDDDSVSIANMAHIIGAGRNGPRSEHELADYVQKNCFDNLIMLCLDCHKIVDELEKRFGVETLRSWKTEHAKRIAALFAVPRFTSEKDLLIEIDQLLEENRVIFETYGPFSNLAMSGAGGDARKIWRRRCLDTILPNNDRIVRLMEKHKYSFGYPWDIYRGFLDFQVHATSFRENCLFEEKVNDYRTFPKSFPNLIKEALGIQHTATLNPAQDGIEYRAGQVQTLIDKFLQNHRAIANMEPISRGVFVVEKKNGIRLRVFVTNTYFVTEYTYEKVLNEDPNISAILCSNPYGGYNPEVKELCLRDNIGLFTLREFMGAINFDGDRFLDFLSSEDRNARIAMLQKNLRELTFLKGSEVYVYGSFLRRSVFADVDLLLVYPDALNFSQIEHLIDQLRKSFSNYGEILHIEACSKRELPQLKLEFDNRVRVF